MESHNAQHYALITGANGGIGQALCQAFTEGGYQVIALDIHSEPVSALLYQDYLAVDLVKFVDHEAYADSVIINIKTLIKDGSLKVLVNNAAIQILGGIDSLTRKDWQTSLNVNLVAPFLLVQGLVDELEKVNGSVVNISSIHAKLTKKNFVAYATSKAALSGMTRAMAVDVGARIRVNAIEPAAIATDMLKEGFVGQPEKYEQLKAYHPTGNIGSPLEVAECALFLTSENNAFLHGCCIDMSGGVSSTLHDPDVLWTAQ